MLEKDLIKQFLHGLALHPRVVFAWRNNTGALPIAKTRARKRAFVRFSEPGISDILGVTKEGIFVAIEVKSPGKKRTLSAHQRAFLDKIKGAGAIAIVADCWEDVENGLMEGVQQGDFGE